MLFSLVWEPVQFGHRQLKDDLFFAADLRCFVTSSSKAKDKLAQFASKVMLQLEHLIEPFFLVDLLQLPHLESADWLNCERFDRVEDLGDGDIALVFKH